MSKKAAIITFHAVPNYGAALQAYALQYKLGDYFEDVSIIDYRPNCIMEEYKCISFYSFFSFSASLWSFGKFLKKKNKFNKFQKKYFNLTDINISNEQNISSDWKGDVLFLGSDQIWNPQITRGFDPVFFGKLQLSQKPLIASYAASIGKSEFTEDESQEFRKLIDNVNTVSVREKQFQELLLNQFKINSLVVADPTILAGKDAFIDMIHSVQYDKYVLCYSLTGMPEVTALGEKIARYKRVRLLEISGRRKAIIKKSHEVIYDAGPEDFVSLISNASYIVTDSFHGTVFSLLFHVPFSSVVNPARGGRIINLLETTGLKNRMTKSFDRQNIESDINWDNVDEHLEALRLQSEEYICHILGGLNASIV